MTVEEEGRQKAVTNYRILAVVDGLLGIGLLTCGGLAVKYSTSDTFGPPYFVGGFVVGILALVQALLCTCIFLKGPESQSDDIKKREVACAITGQYILGMFTFMGIFMSVVFVGISGNLSGSDSFFDTKDEYEEQNKTLSIVILVCCLLMLLVNIFTLYMVCTYGSYFGVVIRQGRRGRAVFINTTMTSSGGTSNLMTLQTEQLRAQNALLQQQILLQQQLAQQQQQNQSPQGVYPPPPPPSYSDAAYPPAFSTPSAPPPAYDSKFS